MAEQPTSTRRRGEVVVSPEEARTIKEKRESQGPELLKNIDRVLQTELERAQGMGGGDPARKALQRLTKPQ